MSKQKYWATGLYIGGDYKGDTVTCVVTDLSEFINAAPDTTLFLSRINADGEEEELGEVPKGEVHWETIEGTK